MHGERRVRRPHKTFTVEVKRARKGAVVKVLGAASPKIEAGPTQDAPQERLTPPVADVPPPRRILEAIEPAVSLDPVSELSQPEPVVATLTPRRPRGRPPKSASVASVPATKEPRVVAKARAAAPTPRKPAATPPAIALEVAPAFAPRPVSSAPGPTPHVTHGDRIEAANSLPRGERWKRRLPKVLW